MLPPSRKQIPPNIFFSVRPGSVPSSARSRAAAFSSYAMITFLHAIRSICRSKLRRSSHLRRLLERVRIPDQRRLAPRRADERDADRQPADVARRHGDAGIAGHGRRGGASADVMVAVDIVGEPRRAAGGRDDRRRAGASPTSRRSPRPAPAGDNSPAPADTSPRSVGRAPVPSACAPARSRA